VFISLNLQFDPTDNIHCEVTLFRWVSNLSIRIIMKNRLTGDDGEVLHRVAGQPNLTVGVRIDTITKCAEFERSS